MELFKKKKKEDDAVERQPTQEAQEVVAVAEVPETEAESVEEVEIQTDEPDTEEDPEGMKMPAASEIAAKLGKPELEEALQTALESLQGGITAGSITDETAQLIALGLDYERAVKEADAAGEIRGRNAAIEEKLLTHNDCDGIPHPGCGQGAASTPRSFSIFDLARSAR